MTEKKKPWEVIAAAAAAKKRPQEPQEPQETETSVTDTVGDGTQGDESNQTPPPLTSRSLKAYPIRGDRRRGGRAGGGTRTGATVPNNSTSFMVVPSEGDTPVVDIEALREELAKRAQDPVRKKKRRS